MNSPDLYSLYRSSTGIETDTRKLRPGYLFFALKGPNFNGNKFVSDAFKVGASYCICDEETWINDERIIYVKNALKALQELASMHRDHLMIPFIAITGSNGKTTTKELVHEVLSKKYKCSTTVGNLNNHIGIPLTILRIPADAEIAVIEMGANHLHEIEGYCEYTKPTHGLITNCGKAHLEGFGGEDGVRKGKGELFDYLRGTKGTAFIYNDYGYLQNMSSGISEVISYGTGNAWLNGRVLKDDNLLEVEVDADPKSAVIYTQLVGGYNLPNVLAAVALGKYFKVSMDEIKQALENYLPSNSRSQLIEQGSNKIILDAYNANPSSMKAAIENIAHMEGDNKVLILGGMMELGEQSKEEHQQIVNLVLQYPWKAVALAGTDYTDLPGHISHFSSSIEVKEWFRQQAFANSTILIKGSRGMQMEKVLEV